MDSKRLNDIPALTMVWRVGNMLIAGQPEEASFETLKNMGVKKIINIRDKDEMDFEFEIDACQNLDIAYCQLPVLNDGELIAENCLKLHQEMNDQDLIMIHCGTANRVAAWLMTYLPLERNLSFDEATELSMNSGLAMPKFIEQARKIVEQNS